MSMALNFDIPREYQRKIPSNIHSSFPFQHLLDLGFCDTVQHQLHRTEHNTSASQCCRRTLKTTSVGKYQTHDI